MKISTVVLDKYTVYKIHKKHGIRIEEVKMVLLDDPFVRKTKFGRYVAIGKVQRFVTIVFGCENGVAEIVTAYPSSDWQVRLYKTRMER